ncbi:MAG: hypothetical protein NVS9B10_04520 [Nevskia sp.]
MTKGIDNSLAARALGQCLIDRGEALATAESCTGGLIAKLLTDISGSSRWFERGLVTYSNEAKRELLGVPRETIDTQGAVSAATVVAMADGLLARAPVQWTISVSGIAGPDGGSADKPVGTVWIGWAGRGIATAASRFVFAGDRAAVREQAAAAALQGLLDLLRG